MRDRVTHRVTQVLRKTYELAQHPVREVVGALHDNDSHQSQSRCVSPVRVINGILVVLVLIVLLLLPSSHSAC